VVDAAPENPSKSKQLTVKKQLGEPPHATDPAMSRSHHESG
jgi:hypothetical protein